MRRVALLIKSMQAWRHNRRLGSRQQQQWQQRRRQWRCSCIARQPPDRSVTSQVLPGAAWRRFHRIPASECEPHGASLRLPLLPLLSIDVEVCQSPICCAQARPGATEQVDGQGAATAGWAASKKADVEIKHTSMLLKGSREHKPSDLARMRLMQPSCPL